MIQANELRIGNWIGLKNSGLLQIDIDNFSDCAKNPAIFNPIPLTPEVLEKAGFGIKSETKDEFGLIIENEGILIELSENYITEGRAVFYYNLPDTQTHKCIAYCKYLHQLQNLYYALTQTELNIKL